MLVFSLGLLFSNMIDDTRAGSLENSMQENLLEVESQNLQLSYLESGRVESCSALETGLNNIIRGYNDRLNRVQQYQDNSIFKGERFGDITRRYVLSGIRYWMFAQDLRSECAYNANTVLFFTTTLEAEDCDECQRQGRQLDLLKQRHRDMILIFSIPTQMEDGMVRILENQYNVTDTPVLVVNGDQVLEGYHSRSEIEQYLDFNNTAQ